MKVVLVKFKSKWQTEYDSNDYSYFVPEGMVVYADDIIAVDTCYGMEIAMVVKTQHISKAEKSKATKCIYSIIRPKNASDRPKPDPVPLEDMHEPEDQWSEPVF